MSEQLAQSSIEIHRAVSTKDKAAEYSWSVKMYAPEGDHFGALIGVGGTTVVDMMLVEIATIDAKLRELFPQADQVKALADAFDAGRQSVLEREGLHKFLHEKELDHEHAET